MSREQWNIFMKCKCWGCKIVPLSPPTRTRCPTQWPWFNVNTWLCHQWLCYHLIVSQHNTQPLNTDLYLLTIFMSTTQPAAALFQVLSQVLLILQPNILQIGGPSHHQYTAHHGIIFSEVLENQMKCQVRRKYPDWCVMLEHALVLFWDVICSCVFTNKTSR